MPATRGEIKITDISPETWSYTSNPPIRVHKVFFSVRGKPGYFVEIPVDQFNARALEQMVIDKANAIVDALDLF